MIQMAILKELVGSIPFAADRDSTFAGLLSAIQGLDLKVHEADKNKGQVVVQCLSQICNLLLWRCWSDKLVFEVRTDEEGDATVNVYAVPNLLRISVAKNEKLTDVSGIITTIRAKALEQRRNGK
jgi:hypothetical protein